jgi:hypothetical protein
MEPTRKRALLQLSYYVSCAIGRAIIHDEHVKRLSQGENSPNDGLHILQLVVGRDYDEIHIDKMFRRSKKWLKRGIVFK